MTEAEVESLLEKPLVARLTSTNRDGTVRITPLWFEQRGKTTVFNTHENTTHARNIKRNGKASVLIDTAEYPYKTVHMIGEARVDERASNAEEIGKMFARYLGSYEKAKAYGGQLISWGKRVFITFVPTKSLTFDIGKTSN